MDKIDPNQKLQAELGFDPIDDELRAIWQPAPAADPKLREKLLAAVNNEPENLLKLVKSAPTELAARRSGGSSRQLAGPQMHAPRRGLSRSVVAAMGAVVLLVGARIAIKQSHLPGLQNGQASQGAASQVDPNELTAEDEQFALGGADDDDSDDSPSVLELAADDE